MGDRKPGWYPYGDLGEVRYWDGAAWESPSSSRPAPDSGGHMASFATKQGRDIEVSPSVWGFVGVFVVLIVILGALIAASTGT